MSETTNLKLFKHDNPSTNTNPFDVEQALNENWDKIDTAVGDLQDDVEENNTNIDTRLTELETDLGTAKTNITNIQAEQTTQNDNIEKNIKDITDLQAENANLKAQIPTGEASGEEISLQDSAEMELVDFSLQGNSEQEITKGLQILENTNEGVTGWDFVHGNGNANISEVVEGGIKCSKFTVTEAMSDYRVLLRDCNLKKLKNNSTYTIAYDLKMNKIGKFNTSICNTAGGNTLAGFPQVNYTTADQWQHIKIVANTHDTTIDNQMLYMTVQPNENGFTEVGDYIEIRNLILAEGDYSEQDLDWERYTGVEAMPNLNFPSGVDAIGDSGNIELVKSNKNLLEFGYDSIASIIFNKNRVTVKNPTSYNYCENLNLKNNRFLSGKKVAFTYVINGEVTGENYVDLIFHSNKRSYIVQKQLNNKHGIYSNEIFTKVLTFDDDEYLTNCACWTAGTTCDLTIDVQVEISDEATDFVEHEGNTYTIPVQKPFYKLNFDGDYNNPNPVSVRDSFIKKDGKWYEKHKITKVNLEDIDWQVGATQEGSSVNYKRWNSVTRYYDDRCGITGTSNRLVLCNYLINKYYTIFSVDELGFNLESHQICIRFPIDVANSATDIKAFWQEKAEEGNGAYVLYPTQEPELIECTEEQTAVLEQIVKDGTFKEVTHFYTTEDLKPTIEVKYYKDLETLFNKQAELENTLNNVQAQLLEIGGN